MKNIVSSHSEILEQHGYSQTEFDEIVNSLKSLGYDVLEVDGSFFPSLDGNKNDLDFASSTDAWMFIDENKHCGIF